MKEYLLGIDIGTSACKAALFHQDGSEAAQADGPYQTTYPRPGWAEQDPGDWWRAACGAVKTLLSRSGIHGDEIAGIGVTGQSWSAVALDSSGALLGPSPIWTDTRAAEQCRKWQQEKRLFALSGNAMRPGYTLPKILWLKEHEPERYRAARCFLQSNSYIVYRLTGVLSQDHSQGYGLQCYDMAKGCWDAWACQLLDIAPEKLPPLYECSEVVGCVTRTAGEEMGLPAGIPVVAGGLDAACGTLGAGVLHPGQTQEQGGQAGGMSICLVEPKSHPQLILGRHVVPGRWLLQGGTTGGGGALRWLQQELCPDCSFREMDALAAAVPAGAEGLLFLPYLAGERSPLWLESARGVFYGLDFRKTRGHFIRAVLEGVALSLHHNLSVARQAGCRVETLHAMGGAANSSLWTQIKADVTGCRIQVPRAETATAWGAALLAGVGCGVYRDFDGIPAVIVKKVYDPDKQRHAAYQVVFEQYLRLIQQVLPLMEEEK